MDSKLINQQGLGLYIHIPFCHTKCTYCDFNTYSGLENLINNFNNSISNEIEFWSLNKDYIVESIFIGGGTPSYVETKVIGNILEKVRNNFHLSNDIEITLEINPEDVSYAKSINWKSMGINRCSVGIQSLDNDELKILNRRHDSLQALVAIRT